MRNLLNRLFHRPGLQRIAVLDHEVCGQQDMSACGVDLTHPCVLPADGHTMHACAGRCCTWGY
jgi:hypothetical protein